MKIEYFDEKEETEFILDNEEKYIINKPKNINIIFFLMIKSLHLLLL